MSTLDEILLKAEDINEKHMPMWQKSLAAGGRGIRSLGIESVNAAKSVMQAGDAFDKQMSGVLDASNKLIGGAFSKIPAVGGALASTTNLLTETFKALLGILMGGYNNFTNLSKAGAAGTQSLEEIQHSARAAGFALMDFGAYTDVIKENAGVMAMYGGTVSQAREKFDDLLSSVHHVEGKYTTQLLLMGMSQEQIIEFAGGWTKLLARTGRAQNMSSEQMALSTSKAAKEMDVLARLTGIQKDELLSEQNKALSYGRFRMAIMQAENSGDEQLAIQGKRAMEMYALAKSSPAMQKAIADTFTQVLTTGEAVGAQILMGGGMYEAIFADASLSTGEVMKMLAGSIEEGINNFGDLERMLGYMTDELGMPASEMADIAQMWKAGDVKAAKAELAKRLKDDSGSLGNIVQGLKDMQIARDRIDKQIIKTLQIGTALFKEGASYIRAGAEKFDSAIELVIAHWNNFAKSSMGQFLFGKYGGPSIMTIGQEEREIEQQKILDNDAATKKLEEGMKKLEVAPAFKVTIDDETAAKYANQQNRVALPVDEHKQLKQFEADLKAYETMKRKTAWGVKPEEMGEYMRAPLKPEWQRNIAESVVEATPDGNPYARIEQLLDAINSKSQEQIDIQANQ